VFASPAAPGDQWEPTPGEIENLLRLDSEAGDDSKMDDKEMTARWMITKRRRCSAPGGAELKLILLLTPDHQGLFT